jgi:UDP-N-acetyl-alpha-D-muramoyl-L-alanyl-L-glutamate epimerase
MHIDPRKAEAFRFVRSSYADGVAELVYAFDDGDELVERITLPDAPPVPPARLQPLKAALRLLHLIAGVSYYKAGVPGRIAIDGDPIDAPTAALLEQVYEHGLGEFAYQNGLDLRGRIRFPHAASSSGAAMRANLERRSLVPIGGGKDSLVTIELLRAMGEPTTVAWVGSSELIAHCAARTALPRLNIGRALAPQLFEMNRAGAYNGHIPVTAINSAILALAAIVYGHDTVVFSNERSASAPTLEHDGREVNHQWSKGYAFEQAFGAYLATHVASDLCYFSLLRPLSELAVTRLFARLTRYHDVFSSCNRNFKILGERPGSRWCGACPKCHFVFLALAPFVAKPQLVAIFGRNLLDDATLAPAFDALMEWNAHKPFECVGEARESRASLAALARRAEWREDAIVARFREEIAPHVDAGQLALEPLLEPAGEHRIPDRYARFDELARA